MCIWNGQSYFGCYANTKRKKKRARDKEMDVHLRHRRIMKLCQTHFQINVIEKMPPHALTKLNHSNKKKKQSEIFFLFLSSLIASRTNQSKETTNATRILGDQFNEDCYISRMYHMKWRLLEWNSSLIYYYYLSFIYLI